MIDTLRGLFQKHARLIGWGSIALLFVYSIEAILKPRRLLLDFANFYDAGHKALLGEFGSLYNEFALIGGQDPFGHMLYFGTPISSLLFAPLALLEPETAAIVFKSFNLVLIVSSLLLLYRHFLPFTDDQNGSNGLFFGLFCVAALLFLPFWTVFYVGGQTTPLILLMLTISLIQFEKERYWVAGVLYALVVLIKPGLAPAAGLLWLFAPRRFKFWAAGSGLFAMGLSILLLGWPVHQAFLDLLSEHSGSLLGIPYHNSHPTGWFEPLFVGPDDYDALDSDAQPLLLAIMNTGVRWALIATMMYTVWRFTGGTSDTRSQRNLIFVSTLFAGMIYAPVVWAHYLSFLFVILVYGIAMNRHFSKPALGIMALILLSAPIGHIWLMELIEHVLAPMGQLDSIVLGIMRATPMTLLVILVLAYRKEFANAYRDRAWDRSIAD